MPSRVYPVKPEVFISVVCAVSRKEALTWLDREHCISSLLGFLIAGDGCGSVQIQSTLGETPEKNQFLVKRETILCTKTGEMDGQWEVRYLMQ